MPDLSYLYMCSWETFSQLTCYNYMSYLFTVLLITFNKGSHVQILFVING